MSPRESIDAWFSANGLRLIGYVVAIALAYATLTAEVSKIETKLDSKIDRVEVRDLLSGMSKALDARAEDSRINRRLLCRLPENAKDTACEDVLRGKR